MTTSTGRALNKHIVFMLMFCTADILDQGSVASLTLTSLKRRENAVRSRKPVPKKCWLPVSTGEQRPSAPGISSNTFAVQLQMKYATA